MPDPADVTPLMPLWLTDQEVQIELNRIDIMNPLLVWMC
jgi:hypothetical protein